jgi:hypothetical protein
MKTKQSAIWVACSALVLFSQGTVLEGCSAGVQAGVAVPTGAEVAVGPPVEHVRAAPEIVYEGHPVYWYHDHWYFRSHGHWNYYRSEPSALHAHRYVVRY